MDLDAILARAPEVVLVDELAHTNVPGSRHEKRWQDVEALLDAGIDVITTVNIQHLASLNDVTEAITGVRQRETVPDEVVRAAEQIELVDMSPEALRRRMAHGNVYAAEKVDAALHHYFRVGNLTALRELALLWLADRVDEGMEQYRDQHEITGTWATRERIVAAVTGGPESATLMRRAARIASRRAGGEWLALYVTRHDGLSTISPDRLDRAALPGRGARRHVPHRGRRRRGGGDPRVRPRRERGPADHRREPPRTAVHPRASGDRRARHRRLGRHRRAHRDARLRPAQQARPERSDPTLGARRRLTGFVFAVAAPTLVSLLLWQTPSLHGLPSEAMVLMALVVATALIGGLLPAVLSAVLSGVLLNLLFTPPRYTLTIAEPENAAAIALFVVVGIAVATVVDHSARQTVRARRARAEADSLTVLAHSLLSSSDDLTGLLSSACELFRARGAAVLRRSGPEWEQVAAVGDAPTVLDEEVVSTAIDEQTFLALRGGGRGDSERGLLNAYAAYAKVMAERSRARAAEMDAHRLREADRTRTALLAAVSHDLRSPLAAVKAAVSSLRSTSVSFSPEDEAALLETIEESTDRLTSLVTNLLDMSRIHTGAVTVHPSEVGLAEATRTAIAPLEGGERITVEVDESLVAVADPGLLDRVLANLSENALKHTSPDAEIRVDAAAVGDRVTLRLADTGPGIGERDLERIFAPFQRLGDVPRNDGVGLGLAVARGLTEAMGGTITTEATPGGGLTFTVDLPRATEETP